MRQNQAGVLDHCNKYPIRGGMPFNGRHSTVANVILLLFFLSLAVCAMSERPDKNGAPQAQKISVLASPTEKASAQDQKVAPTPSVAPEGAGKNEAPKTEPRFIKSWELL